MKLQATLLFLYGLLLLIGGIIGHFKANSPASLIAGIVFGVLAIGNAFAFFKGLSWAYPLGFILSSFLFLFFTYRFFLSYRFMPAGLMACLSLVLLLLLFWTKRS